MDFVETQNSPIRWEGDVISDCILLASGLNEAILERFLKVYT
jgi:hypothetical protein